MGNLHVRGEDGQSLVEVVHLGEDTHGGKNHEHVGRGVGELVVAGKSKLEGDSESLDRHDGDGADGRADRKVDECILLAVNRGNLVDHDEREDDDGDGVEKESCNLESVGVQAKERALKSVHTWLNGIVQNLVNGLNVLIRRGMEHNDDGADEADGATELAQRSQLLLKEVRSEDSTD